jgi:hypothetical protein
MAISLPTHRPAASAASTSTREPSTPQDVEREDDAGHVMERQEPPQVTVPAADTPGAIPQSSAPPSGLLHHLDAEEMRRRAAEERNVLDWARWRADAHTRIFRVVLGDAEARARVDVSFAGEDVESGWRTVAVDAYLRSFIHGKPLPTGPLARDLLRHKVSIVMFNGRGGDSDEAFHAELVKAAQGRKDFEALSKAMGEEAVKSVILGSLEPERARPVTFAEWRKGNAGGISSGLELSYVEMWGAVQDGARASLERVGPELAEVWTAMKQGGAGSPSEVAKAFFGDLLDSASGGEKGGNTLSSTRRELGKKDAGAVAFDLYKRISPEDREAFMGALGILARTLPKEQQADLMANFAKEAGAVVDAMAGGVEDYVRRNSQMLETMAGGEFTVPLTVVESAQHGEEKARAMQAARDQAQKDYTAARNFRADVRRIEQEVFSPTIYLSEDSKDVFSLRTLERGFYGVPGALISSAVAALPFGIGPVLTYAHMESSAYDTLRFNLKDAGMSEELASRYAGQLSGVVAVPSAILERIGASAWMGRLPFLEEAMKKAGNRISSDALRYLLRAGAMGAEETAIEVTQNLLPHIVQEAGAALSRDIKGVRWQGEGGALDGFWSETASTFIAMLPLSLFGAAGGFSTDRRMKALAGEGDLALQAFGFAPERIAAFREAEKLGHASMAKALEDMDRTRDPRGETARKAVEELDRRAKAEQDAAGWLQQNGMLPRTVLEDDGAWTLYDTSSNEVIGTATNHQDAARMAVAHAKLDTERHADQISRITTAYQAAELTGQWAAEAGRSQRTELDLSRRLTVKEAAEEADAARQRAEMQEKVKGGDGSMAGLVFGVSTTETEDGVRRTVNRILGGGSILTVFHEDAHALRREAHARGILTRQDDIAILRAVDTVMDGRPGREGQRLSLLPENFDSLSQADQEVAIDEGIAELMEAEVIRTRKGGGARQLPAGIISRNMAAIARLAGPQAAGRFGSFIEAFRGFFGLATDRAHRIRRSLADGSLDKADYDAYFGKLVGHAEDPVAATTDIVATAERTALTQRLVDIQMVMTEEGDSSSRATSAGDFTSVSTDPQRRGAANSSPPYSPPREGIPRINGRLPINHRYAGKMHPAGVWFNEHGFPDFSPFAFIELEVEGLTGDYSLDIDLANQNAGFTETPDGYAWHHVEDGLTIQLVPRALHRMVRHTGGAAILRNGGYDR